MKRIHEEGTKAIWVTVLIAVVAIILLNCFFHRQTVVHYLLYVYCLIHICWTFRFFRVPFKRLTTSGENMVLSAADGEVVANEIVMEDEYFHEQRRQISIFMSIYNVHVNFFPFDGIVTYYKYHPGNFVVAFNPKSSDLNEHNTIVAKDLKGREVMMRQIAGFVARRIVCDLQLGDELKAGEELGMIRFGSRVDMFLPLDADVKIKIGDKVRSKVTVIAELK